MKNSREGLAVMALGVITVLLAGLVPEAAAVRWIGAVVCVAGFIAWQWHARRDLRQRKD
ncbi:hypothetical protein ABEG17_02385 [Pedococcus sp. KACC 23699]|uniref:Uncharacterized protein n=1 Tax=Pedococcus sp. KACC 23699 TaxID=3149228 RepID=A0AAU7JVE9_9MICO